MGDATDGAPVEPVASVRVDILEQTRKLMREYYRAIEDELEYHNCGRTFELRATPPHGSMLCGVSIEDRDVDRTLSLICIEADTLDTPVMRVVVQRRVP